MERNWKEILDKLLDFDQFLFRFQRVERASYVPETLKRRENDAEHTFNVAMLSWYLCEVLELPYDQEKILKYALAHDLVEAYAGDVLFNVSAEEKQLKKEREEEALERIRSEFSEFPQLIGFIERYEGKGEPEAVFVNAVDKLAPALMNYSAGGEVWRDYKITFGELVENKRRATAGSREILGLFNALETYLEQNKEKLFHVEHAKERK